MNGSVRYPPPWKSSGRCQEYIAFSIYNSLLNCLILFLLISYDLAIH